MSGSWGAWEPDGASDIKGTYTYTHRAIRGILHLGLVKLHLLLMQHRLDLCVLPSDDLK